MGQTPEIIGYYAANLNAGILTVRSANPNALLFAFKNGLFRSVPSPSSRDKFRRQSIPVHPRKGLHKPPSNKLVEVARVELASCPFIDYQSANLLIFKHTFSMKSTLLYIL